MVGFCYSCIFSSFFIMFINFESSMLSNMDMNPDEVAIVGLVVAQCRWFAVVAALYYGRLSSKAFSMR